LPKEAAGVTMNAVASTYETGRVVDHEAGREEREAAGWLHRASLIGILIALFTVGFGTPVVLLVAAIMWLARRGESPFVDDHGREAVNFLISLTIYWVVAWTLAVVLIGFLLMPAIALLSIVGTWKGAKAAERGEYYRYPACIRLVG
jgi:uncharacterized Tic20 family protein